MFIQINGENEHFYSNIGSVVIHISLTLLDVCAKSNNLAQSGRKYLSIELLHSES